MRSLCLIKVIIFINFVTDGLSLDKDCDPYKQVLINTTGDAEIAIFFSFRGPAKLYGCNSATLPDLVIAFESIKRSIEKINQDFGEVNGIIVNDSYIPGIKIGLKGYDYCTQQNIFLTQLVNLWPKLKTEARLDKCDLKPFFLGLFSAISELDNEIFGTIKRAQIPFFNIRQLVNSPIKEAPNVLYLTTNDHLRYKATADLIKQLKCNKVYTLIADVDINVNMADVIEKYFVEVNITVTKRLILSPTATFLENRKIINTLVQQNTTLIVHCIVVPISVLKNFFEAACNLDSLRKITWIIVDFQMAPLFYMYPYLLQGSFLISPDSDLTTFKAILNNINAESQKESNPWYLIYYMITNSCKLPGVTHEPYNSFPTCTLPAILDKKQISEGFMTVGAILFTHIVTKAFRNAWNTLCNGQRGMCSQLRLLPQNDFIEKFVKHVEISFGPDDRIFPEFFGQTFYFNSTNNALQSKYKTKIFNLQKMKNSIELIKTFEHNGEHLINVSPYQLYDHMNNPVSDGNKC